MKEQFRITFQVNYSDNNYHRGLVKTLMDVLGGTFINECEGSTSRTTYTLLTYSVPISKENYIGKMHIDLGSSSNYIIEF